MKKAALIPARIGSTRLPQKLLRDLGGVSVIQRTYESTRNMGLYDEVWVVTDDEGIGSQIESCGGRVFYSQQVHESGSDRIAEALQEVDASLIVNVQGDEPFQQQEMHRALLKAFSDESVQVASLYHSISEAEAVNPAAVKVVIDSNGDALYFSRALIPFNRDATLGGDYKKHIGIYAYRREVLLEFTRWPKSQLEQLEMLEQLRLLERGRKIRMVKTAQQPISIDTHEDLDRARDFLEKNSNAGQN